MDKIKVVIDCDPGIDDILALLYALKCPNLEVVAITVVAGNVDENKGINNVTALLGYLNKDIPIYKGGKSLKYINAEDTHGENGLGNYHDLDYYAEACDFESDFSADKYLSNIEKDEGITVIALGPLTNIWAAYKLNTSFFHNVNIVSMGGAYRTNGNCSPVSEYNYWCDPDSAKNVFEVLPYSKKFKVVPLDVTRRIVLNETKIKDIKYKNEHIYKLVKGITRFYIDFHLKQEGLNGCVINDPLAVVAVSKPELLLSEPYYMQVCNADGPTRGQLLVDTGNFYHQKPNALICHGVNVSGFWDEFISVICS